MAKTISPKERALAEAGQEQYQYKQGMRYVDDGCLEEGQHWLEQAAGRNHIPALYALGSLLYDTGRGKEAISPFARAANLGRSASLTALIGIVIFKGKRWGRRGS